MTLAEKMLRQLDDPNLDNDSRAILRCQIATELEHRGQYEMACDALGELWQGIGKRPMLDGLIQRTRAEVLLCVGILSGSLGSANQVKDAQEAAKDLISESMGLFEALGDMARAAAAQGELGVCYWRAGAYDDARVFLEQAFLKTDEKNIEQKAKTLIRRTLVEFSTSRFHDALRLLTDAASMFEANNNDALKGRFHNQLALVLECIGTSECRPDYIDRAIVEYTAAIFHFERAGHTNYRARDENNLGFLLYSIERYVEAQEHLDYARRLFIRLKDISSVAQVDETRTRLLLAQERFEEAEKVVRESVRVLEQGEAKALLAEALTTRGVVLARLGRFNESGDTLRRAIDVAEQAGALEDAGLAALTLLEEHGERLAKEERQELYLHADEWLTGTQDASHAARLRKCARWVVDSRTAAQIKDSGSTAEIEVSGETARTGDSVGAERREDSSLGRGVGKVEETAVEKVAGSSKAGEASVVEEGSKVGQGLAVFVCEDEGMRELVEVGRQFAGTGLPLLISGETGVGKEALARAIHGWSGRVGAFVTFNCAGLDEEGVESQLFGQGGGGGSRDASLKGEGLKGRGSSGRERVRDKESLKGGGGLKEGGLKDGSLKGGGSLDEGGKRNFGVEEYSGAVREAAGGTLFVDEIGELDWVSQGKLLRLLERGEVVPVGAAAPEKVEVRVVAATRGDLGQLVARGKFRQDLFYRFEAFEIRIPALRERAGDIGALARYFVEEIGAREKRSLSVSEGGVAALRKLPLRGNVRELRAIIERAVMLSKGNVVSEATLEMSLRHTTGRATATDPWAGFSLHEEMRRYEEQFIERALKDAHGSVTQASRLLGLRHHQSLSSLIELKHPRLLEMRTPVKPRRRSIIKK